MLPITRLLCPTDFSDPSCRALERARELALHFDCELCVLHVIPVVLLPPTDPNRSFWVPEYEQMLHAEAEEQLRVIQRDLACQGVKASTMVAHGHAGDEIARIAHEQKFDMVVIATRGQGMVRHLLFGSVTERVLRLAKCPVLSIPAAA